MLTEFERKAWDARTQANQHKPEMAAKAALDDIERGIHKPISLVVLIVEENGDEQSVTFYHAGDLSDFALEGAMMRAIRYNQEQG